ncbi:MAG: acid phosphatase [Gammaproteobacteria bacterium]|nr:acid phosphatase [Gammaproteobacteria bacterium]MDH4255182.1 acid phosphatase [Gammaproteobacteria bacterium]
MHRNIAGSDRELERRRFVAWLLAGGLASPLAASAARDEGSTPGDAGLRNPLLWAVAWKQTAAEFGALCHQAYNVARLRVDMAIAAGRGKGKPAAVITDMDDTIIHAKSYWGYLVNEGLDFFDDALWDRWLPENLVTAVPGALDFLRHCESVGVEVFYVTNRDQGERTYDYALGQLRHLEFPWADEAHLTVYRDTSDKSATREQLAASHDLLLMLGDNLNDYKRDYYVADVDERYALMERDRLEYGVEFVLLPNPTDGHWVRAIFGDSEPAATDDNRRRLREAAARIAWDGR